MKAYWLILVVALLAIAGGIYFYISHTHTGEVACTTDAMMCPDGSAVGRTGPDCSFAPCPGVSYALAADLYPLYPGASWGPVASTTSPDYGPVDVVQSTPFANLTDIAAKSTPFTAYYHALLLKAGWVQDMLREAGGPGSEVSVYTKGNQFIVVSFHSVFHVQSQDAPEECPCDLQFSLMSGVAI